MELDKGAPLSLEQLLEDQTFRCWVLNRDEEAAAYWARYSQSRPEEADTVEQARILLLDLVAHFEQHDLPAKAIESGLESQLQQLGAPGRLGRPAVRLRQRLRPWAVAATVLLLVLAAATWWWNRQDPELVYGTTFAEWKTVELPDGSEVKLNANSVLSLDSNWTAGQTRRVHLQGEAYFAVQKKPGAGSRFQVVADGLVVEVLGTRFNVHSRGEQTEVFLEEGRVRLAIAAAGMEEVTLSPGQKLTYSSRQQAILHNGPASAALQLAWTDGLLRFENTPMREVLQKVQDIYGITFRVEQEALYDRPITSQGVPMAQLDVTLPILAKALDATISLQDEVYVIE